MFTPGALMCAYKTVSGRPEWPSRDPMNEYGSYLERHPSLFALTGTEAWLKNGWEGMSQNFCGLESQPYRFTSNDGVNKYDLIGLMSAQDIVNAFQQRAAQTAAANTPCWCYCSDQKDTYSISGAGVTLKLQINATTSWKDCGSIGSGVCCGPFNTTYYWWDCYTGTEQGDKNNLGWSTGSASYSKVANPYDAHGDPDPWFIDVASVAIYERCVNGKLQTKMAHSNRLEWAWNSNNGSWMGPSSH